MGLLQVLSPLLLPEELHFIFGRVGMLFSKSLADAYARLEPLVGPSPPVMTPGLCRCAARPDLALYGAS